MSLGSGTRLGPYEIVEPIGAGGMGEVYRARDTKLGRDVAIKVLPEELADDPERVARFEREAKLLASLNHPNIASIYGFEDGDDVKALALELVEGPTLAERISEGPFPIGEVVTLADQMAKALVAGHEAGVIHRDLKPANIKLKGRRHRQGARLRPRQGARGRAVARVGLRALPVADHHATGNPDGRDPGHRPLHEPGASEG